MPPAVIYLLGTSFTGSTILGALLGSQPGSLCAGELGNWTMRPGSLDLPCSCGTRRAECPFWSAVRSAWLNDNPTGWQAYQHLQKNFERLHRQPLLNILPKFHHPEFVDYAHSTRRLFTSLQQVSGQKVVIDITKRLGRARALSAIPGLEIGWLHLVRDGRAYLASSLKHKQRQWHRSGRVPNQALFLARTSLEWAFLNRLAENLLAASPAPFLRLRYEDLLANPAAVLQQVSTAFSLDLSSVQASLAAGQPLQFGHMGGGNQLRLAGPAHLFPAAASQDTLPPHASRLFWALAGGSARRYHYAPQNVSNEKSQP